MLRRLWNFQPSRTSAGRVLGSVGGQTGDTRHRPPQTRETSHRFSQPIRRGGVCESEDERTHLQYLRSQYKHFVNETPPTSDSSLQRDVSKNRCDQMSSSQVKSNPVQSCPGWIHTSLRSATGWIYYSLASVIWRTSISTRSLRSDKISGWFPGSQLVVRCISYATVRSTTWANNGGYGVTMIHVSSFVWILPSKMKWLCQRMG